MSEKLHLIGTLEKNVLVKVYAFNKNIKIYRSFFPSWLGWKFLIRYVNFKDLVVCWLAAYQSRYIFLMYFSFGRRSSVSLKWNFRWIHAAIWTQIFLEHSRLKQKNYKDPHRLTKIVTQTFFFHKMMKWKRKHSKLNIRIYLRNHTSCYCSSRISQHETSQHFIIAI